jgi:hypothetical protein
MAPILEGKAAGCNRLLAPSGMALFVPGDGLKRKRIVRTAEVTIETEEHIVLRDAGVIGISFKDEAGKKQPHLCTPCKDGLTNGVSEFKGARPGQAMSRSAKRSRQLGR